MTKEKVGNYERYMEAPFNRPDYYRPVQSLDPERYQPLGAWMGRLILPDIRERTTVLGTWLEVHHAPPEYAELVGTRVRLRWAQTPDHNARMWGATRDVHFTESAYKALEEGVVLAERVNKLGQVNPLESLAAAHPYDDVEVRLDGRVAVKLKPSDGGPPIVGAFSEPVQVTGRFYALVRFVGPAGADGYKLRHYNRATGAFDGPEEIVGMPEVVPDGNGVRNSTAAGIEDSPLNELGWYIAGAQALDGRFVVQALTARKLIRLEPDLFCDRTSECMEYLRPKAWKRSAPKGAATVALLCGDGVTPHTATESWHEGDQGLLIHLYGGIGGDNTEPAAKSPLYWGHFAQGRAQVVREPLSGELVFDIVYHQIYAHNPDGITAGALHYTRYSGDRQFGWAGVRPIQDVIVKLDAVTGNFVVMGQPVSALAQIVKQLEVMAARYRIADGRGSTSVTPLHNCAQDSAQALFAAIRAISKTIAGRPELRAELTDTPEEAQRLVELTAVGDELQRVLLPWGAARDDWEYGMTLLGSDAHNLFDTIGKAARSWRTMLPPVVARALIEVFLERGGSAWVLRTFQVGGNDPSIEPYVPNV